MKKVGVKAASMWGEVGRLGHEGKPIGLLWQVHEDLSRPGRGSPGALRKDLRQLRARFELEACKDAKKTAAGARSPRREKR